jgi:CheY-like chemotaxis protein
LSIASQLVTAMGGRLAVHSRVGSGTTFTIDLQLPVCTAEAAAASTAPADATPARAGAQASALHGKVLLVEDNEVNALIAMESLKRLGMDVFHCADGERAVAAYTAGEFDIVLMDCEMPVMDGFAATRELRSVERLQGRRRSPIVALTAHAFPEHRDACIAGGMDDYLAKPLDHERLRFVVVKWLAKRDGIAAPAPQAIVAQAARRRAPDHRMSTGPLELMMTVPGALDDLPQVTRSAA